MLGAVFEHQLGLRAVFADDVMITKCERPIQNNCSFTLKEKSNGDDIFRHKSSKLKKHNEKSVVERQLQKARGVRVRTHWKCMRAPRAAIASTVLHGNKGVN